MRKILILLTCLVSIIFAVSACGGSGDKVATVGTSEITVSEDTPTDTFYERVRALSEKEPYLPWFNTCIVREAKKILTPAEAKELESGPKAEGEKRLLEVFSTASKICESTGKRYVNPAASEEELEMARSSEVAGTGAMLRAEGVPEKIVSCMEGQIGTLSTKELLMMIEAERSERERFFEGLGAQCESG